MGLWVYELTSVYDIVAFPCPAGLSFWAYSHVINSGQTAVRYLCHHDEGISRPYKETVW